MTNLEDELIEAGSKLAQELRDIITEAEEAGCENPFPGTQALIDEWESVYQKTELAQNLGLNDEEKQQLETMDLT